MGYPQQDPYQQQPPVPYSPGPAYPAPMYPGPVIVNPQVPASGMATASMVLGILGVLGGWCLLGIPCIIAVVCGHIALTQTKDGSKSGRGQAVAGLIMGYLVVGPAIALFFLVVVGGIAGSVDPSVNPTP